MNRKILVHSDHTRFEKILFRDKEGQLCDYELNTITFPFWTYACFKNWTKMYVTNFLWQVTKFLHTR